MFNGFNAREILAESYRNRRGIPFTPIQCFDLPLTESLSDACRLGPPASIPSVDLLDD